MKKYFISILLLLSNSFAALLHPENGSVLNTTHVKFEWEQIPDATEYIIEINGSYIGESESLIYISTDQVYGNSTNRCETNKNLYPINIYGKTKLYGENEVIKHLKNYIIVRTNIFGWNTKPLWTGSVEWIYSSLISKKIIYLFDDYIFTPIYTKELCKIIDLSYL